MSSARREYFAAYYQKNKHKLKPKRDNRAYREANRDAIKVARSLGITIHEARQRLGINGAHQATAGGA